MTYRKILHLDLDAFFCAVEEQYDPSLRGKAFAVGGRPEARGVVASCSYAARRFGVRSAMPMARALKLCPDLTIVSSRHGVYSKVSHQVMQHLHNLATVVEQISIDEAFLDVSDLPESGEVLARRLQATIHKECNLPCSLGVATNKLMAKIANDVGKASYRGEGPPNAITVVPPGQEAAFLAPLPVDTLWGVGPKTAERLHELGIYTIGDLAGWSVDDLTRRFGKHGYDLARRAQGIDDRPLETEHETKSISQETTFSKDVRSGAVLRRTLLQQSESVGRRLRSAGLAGTTVKIKLRWPDFTTLTRQVTLDQPSNQDGEIFEAAITLLEENWRSGQAVRLIGVGVSGLGSPVRQLSLWDDSAEKGRRLQSALDELRERFGKDVLQRGAYFGAPDDDATDENAS
jgi:DNA polymerase-4